MKRIIIHWAGSAYSITPHIKSCYHFIVDNLGNVTPGIFKPEDNENCADGKYAQHVGGGNTGSIGISMLGMYGFEFDYKNNIPRKIGPYPLTAKQCEACWKKVAQLCKQYNIPITPDTVMTHYEFGVKHPSTSSAGKPDIIYLPPFPEITRQKIGDYIRGKVKWYYEHI